MKKTTALLPAGFLAILAAAADTQPATRKLTWAPPELENPATLKIEGENPQIKLDPARDYILEMPKDKPVLGELSIWGGRNVTLIGGEILLKKGHWRAVYLQEQTGVIHIEGVYIHGDPPESLSEGFNFGLRQPNCVVQIQNVRIDTLYGGMNANHSDLIQTWAGPAELRVDGLTGYTGYQGMFLLPNQHFALDIDGFLPKKWVFKNINIIGTEDSAYMLWAQGKAEQWPMEIENVWVRPNSGKRGNRDAFLMPNDGFWDGVREGVPPNGDFVPEGLAGRHYVSPGYLNPPSVPLDIPLRNVPEGFAPYPVQADAAIDRGLVGTPGSDAPAEYLVIDLSGGTAAETFPARQTATPPDLGDDTCRATELWLRKILPGTFVMGSPDDEPGRGKSREVYHQVTLTTPFYMGVFPVTQKQYALVTGNDPSSFKGDTRPVEMVNFRMIRGRNLGPRWPLDNQVDADSFMGVLRQKSGLVVDLPTEAQWEYACRAGTETAFHNGKGVTGNVCPNMAETGRYRGNMGDGRGGYENHTKVGMYQPNAWGLYDMHGNVSEWCLDRWVSNLGCGPAIDPVGGGGEADAKLRALRGGSWNDGAGPCRAAYRVVGDALCCVSFYGFRVCAR